MEILPGVLAYNQDDFRKHLLHHDLRAVASMFHVDVLDNSLFPFKSWADPSVIGRWKNLPEIELHCMVARPVQLVEAWQTNVPTLKRVIVHFEIGRSLSKVITQLRAFKLEILVAVNPSTPIDEPAQLSVDGLLIMGVEPGRSGQKFLGEPMLAKMRRAKALFPDLSLALDGGLSEANIKDISRAGVSHCVASSALWKSAYPAEAYINLHNKIS